MTGGILAARASRCRQFVGFVRRRAGASRLSLDVSLISRMAGCHHQRASLADMSLLTRTYHSVLDRLVAAATH